MTPVEGNVIIFDEAHNVEKSCEEAASLGFSSFQLGQCIDEIDKLIAMPLGSFKNPTSEELIVLRVLIITLEEHISALSIPTGGVDMPGAYIFELFKAGLITLSNSRSLIKVVTNFYPYLNIFTHTFIYLPILSY